MTNPHPDEYFNIDGVDIYIPVHAMKIGDSVFFPCVNMAGITLRLYKLFQQRGFKFTYRERIEQEVLGIRVWRVV